MHYLYSKALLNSRAIPIFLKTGDSASSGPKPFAALSLACATMTVSAILEMPEFSAIYKVGHFPFCFVESQYSNQGTHDLTFHTLAFPVLLLVCYICLPSSSLIPCIAACTTKFHFEDIDGRTSSPRPGQQDGSSSSDHVASRRRHSKCPFHATWGPS